METSIFIISAILMGGFMYMVFQSFKSPQERTIQIITRFGKFYCYIMAVNGYHPNNPHRKKYFEKEKDKWDIWDIVENKEDYKPSWREKFNIYFFLWPIFRTYVYPFSYTKLKKKGDVRPNDNVIWSDDKTGESVISRTGMSDYIDFQSEYPTITGNLFTNEMAKVLVFTNNTLQATNPFKMLFRINNWLGITTETIGGALRGVIGKLSMQQLNQVRSESEDTATTSDFTHAMIWINRGKENMQDGIEELWGVKLKKSVFKAFTPADTNAETLMNSFLQPKIAEEIGNAAVIKATKDAKVTVVTATAKATAYGKEQKAIVDWKKKYLVQTGLAEVDKKGNITKLVPDANVRVSAEALKELAKLRGTLVMGDVLNTMLSIPPTKKGVTS